LTSLNILTHLFSEYGQLTHPVRLRVWLKMCRS